MNSHRTKNTSLTLAFLASAAIVAGALFFQPNTPLQAQSLFKAFGGTITYVEYCCNGIVLSISGPRGINAGDYFIDYSSTALPTVNYMNYQVFYGGGQNTIGIASPFGYCVEIGEDCEAGYSVSGTITKIGTSVPGN